MENNQRYGWEYTTEEINEDILAECTRSGGRTKAAKEGGSAPLTPEDEERVSKARSAFSLSHIAIAVFILTSQILGVTIQIAAMLLLTPEQIQNPEVLGILTIIINVVAMYITAFPVFIIIAKHVPKASPVEKKKMGIGELAMFFVISQAAMFIGAIIGNYANELINNMTGVIPENSLDTIVSSIPMWLTLLVAVIIGPIIEEIMFRKILIDRLSVVGDGTAIIFSALAFGIFHGNFYQLFYATFIGLIFGYVYTKTRKLRYTIILHMLVNFMGSIVPEAVEKLCEIAPETVVEIITIAYTYLQYSFVPFGIMAAVLYIVNHGLKIRKERDLSLPEDNKIRPLIVNPGVIIYYALCAEIMLTTIIIQVLEGYLG